MADPTPDARAVENFRSYLRIPSVHPDVDYADCVEFLTGLAEDIGLPYTVLELAAQKPIVLVTWEGTSPQLPAILFNSHMDVVPVFRDQWSHDPFAAEMDPDGNIFARGSQDTKCLGIEYLEAVRRLLKSGQRLKRTVHISFVPDEEIGGELGMKLFAQSQQFRDLHLGCAFDEGTANADDSFVVYYGERTIWQVEFHITGTTGHGSLLLKDTAGEKMRRLVDRVMDFRQSQVDLLAANPQLTVGDVTTVNLTIIKGGVQVNVVPPELSVSFDMRIDIEQPLDVFQELLEGWVAEAGDGVTMNFIVKNIFTEPTHLDDTNPYWVAFKRLLDDMGLPVKTSILNGGTDGRYVRQAGLPVLGFSPNRNTPPLMHANDEFLNVNTFLAGIDLFQRIIPAVANI